MQTNAFTRRAPGHVRASLMNPSAHLLPADLAAHTVESLFAEHGAPRPWIYWLVLFGVIGALASLPLIDVDVSVRAAGLVRPTNERAELRSAVAGILAEVLVRDNDRVADRQPLLVLHSGDLNERLARNRAQQAEHAALIADLKWLINAEDAKSAKEPDRTNISALAVTSAFQFQTHALRQEHAQFLAQADSSRLAEAKARNELARYTTLAGKGIATQQDLDNARYEAERLEAESRLLVEQTLSRWQGRLRDELTAQANLASQAEQLREAQAQFTLRAPADGVLVGFTGWSAGGFIAAGQSLGAVSPEGTLQMEVYVSPRDIGLVRVGQAARLQIDAYPYTQWGTLDGTVTGISGDLVGGVDPNAATGNGRAAPAAFKVLVRPNADFLTLPNGVRGDLKKGLTLPARFLVARRSVFQLLYEDVSAWLDPQDNRPAPR